MKVDSITELASKLPSLGFTVDRGLGTNDFNTIAKAFGVDMPRDLQDLLAVCVPISHATKPTHFINWHSNPEEIAAQTRVRIAEMLKFDIVENEYWCHIFGPRPDDLELAIKQAQKTIATWPPLFPLYGHRYVPAAFLGEHPPVISFPQFTDVIVYGDSLYDYLNREFNLSPVAAQEAITRVQDLPYWGEAFKEE